MFPKKIKTGYESDTTRFINDLLEKKPEILEERQRGRSMWWDKKLDLEKLKRDQESHVKPSPYVYQNY
ncbi:MAG TPA: DUF3460 family protein [Burkholderiales bacterium]|nr:DUF3460 family protein [Burkholderiales bacterium]